MGLLHLFGFSHTNEKLLSKSPKQNYEKGMERMLDNQNLNHIAIIMDGNGRWAEEPRP